MPRRCRVRPTTSSRPTRARSLRRTRQQLSRHRPEIDFPEEADPYDDAIYAHGRDELARLIDEEPMVEDDEPGMFVCGSFVTDVVSWASCAPWTRRSTATVASDATRRPARTRRTTGPVTSWSRAATPRASSSRIGTPRMPREIRGSSCPARQTPLVAAGGVTHTLAGSDPRRSSMHSSRCRSSRGHHRSAAGERAARDRASDPARRRRVQPDPRRDLPRRRPRDPPTTGS